MRIPRIYHPAVVRINEPTELTARAAQHVGKVLRLRSGAHVILFDGQGHAWRAEITDMRKNAVHATPLEIVTEQTESQLHIHLGLGISKGERMDYAIQKAVETGVSAITPLLTEYTVVRLDTQRQENRAQHWQGVIQSACEQCGRNTLPALHPISSVTDWLPAAPCESKLVFDGGGEHHLRAITAAPHSVCILIGPEGGLSETEIRAALQYGFLHTRLGPRVLRSETAAVAVIAALQTLWGDYT